MFDSSSLTGKIYLDQIFKLGMNTVSEAQAPSETNMGVSSNPFQHSNHDICFLSDINKTGVTTTHEPREPVRFSEVQMFLEALFQAKERGETI